MVLATRQGGLATPAAAHPFKDDKIVVVDDLDPTKRIRFEVGAIAPGTTRVVTFPDQDITLGGMIVVTDLVKDIDFVAAALQDFTLVMDKQFGIVLRSRIFVDADPGAAFSDVGKLSFYSESTRLGKDLIARFNVPIVYTELSTPTSVGSPNFDVDDATDLNADDSLLFDTGGTEEFHSVLSLGAPNKTDDNFANVHAIDTPVSLIANMGWFNFFGDGAKTVYGRLEFPAAVTINTKLQVKTLTHS